VSGVILSPETLDRLLVSVLTQRMQPTAAKLVQLEPRYPKASQSPGTRARLQLRAIPASNRVALGAGVFGLPDEPDHLHRRKREHLHGRISSDEYDVTGLTWHLPDQLERGPPLSAWKLTKHLQPAELCLPSSTIY
jgi:hypothetical protein